ncbi:MAG: Cytochrome c bacterial [Candidatus Hinthialibacteria bacterium OLB16]|nr:MAG: Cytochrome c bacterial [Candidatus Hinthialibacteria bacterium OLB16]MBK7494433.1 hypothetical protein [Candidatus Omnitrophota bacterium]
MLSFPRHFPYLLAASVLLVWSQAQARTDHRFFIDQYRGPAQCIGCHSTAFSNTPAISLKDIHHSVHYRFESKLPDNYQHNEAGAVVEYATSGLLWKMCGLPSTVPQFNWLSNIKDLPETQHVDKPSGCGTCHAGIGLKPYTALGQSKPAASEDNNIDCLVCHALNYDRKYFTATLFGQPELDAKGQPIILSVPRINGVLNWSVYTDAARTVGSTNASTCLRCHADLSDSKVPADDHHYGSCQRGVVFAADQDVHASAGMSCSKCHDAGQHKMKRPLNNDLSAHDVVIDHQMCTDCHGQNPHDFETYNEHAGFVSCTACHARTEKTAAIRDFAVVVPPDPNNPLSIYSVGISDATPDYKVSFAWFDGSVGPENKPRGARGDGKSRIYPYKPVGMNLPRDADGNVIPPRWDSFFKTGNMMDALAQGRNEYAALWTPEIGAKYGLPPVPGEFDHFAASESGFSISHGITRKNAYKCASCHNPAGVMDFEKLGYSEEKSESLENLLGLPPVGDLNGDGKIDAFDLLIFQNYWHGNQDAMLKALKNNQ